MYFLNEGSEILSGKSKLECFNLLGMVSIFCHTTLRMNLKEPIYMMRMENILERYMVLLVMFMLE